MRASTIEEEQSELDRAAEELERRRLGLAAEADQLAGARAELDVERDDIEAERIVLAAQSEEIDDLEESLDTRRLSIDMINKRQEDLAEQNLSLIHI